MPRKVTLRAINSELKLATSGITIAIDDPDDHEKSGRLSVGKAKIVWTPWRARKGGPQDRTKTWEDLIDFFRR